jgi:hypothetical protein
MRELRGLGVPRTVRGILSVKLRRLVLESTVKPSHMDENKR